MKATVKPPQFVRLKGLPGARSVVRAVYVRSITDAVRWLRKRKSVTSSGELGTLNVFYTAKGEIVAECIRSKVTFDSTPCKSVAAAYRWLIDHWQYIG
ncbi:hypothetical protein UFOVP1229_65 [uncultured Caudovirales phage]|uniref:Uncharacterized protein n=1 Tax=uncultured Caudovirales phage TaxID=2100421 RepID=A0A6J5R4G3_9CAUD|nr:hypothetical protein UFOVP1229_65 [uncultured Caudovirales phage]